MFKVKIKSFFDEDFVKGIRIVKDAALKGCDYKQKMSVIGLVDSIMSQSKLCEEYRGKTIKEFGDDKDGEFSISPKHQNWGLYLGAMDAFLAQDAELDVEYEKIQCPKDVFESASPGSLIALREIFHFSK